MTRNPKPFRALILNHVDAGQSWSVIASEFDGYEDFQRWLDHEPLHPDHLEKLHEIDFKWREELDITAKNKYRNKS